MEHNSKERKTSPNGRVKLAVGMKPEEMDMLEKLAEADSRTMTGEVRALIRKAFLMEFPDQKTA